MIIQATVHMALPGSIDLSYTEEKLGENTLVDSMDDLTVEAQISSGAGASGGFGSHGGALSQRQ